MKRFLIVMTLATLTVAPPLAGTSFAQQYPSNQAASPEKARPPADPNAFVTLGIGLPTLLHIEAGFYLSRSTSLDLVAAIIVFNAMAGVGATQWFPLAEGKFNHDLGVSAHVYLNALDEPFEFSSGSERLGLVTDLMFAYAFTLDAGFTIRAKAGLLIYDDAGVVASPNFTTMAGWRF